MGSACARGPTNLRGEKGCLPERCCASQEGNTLLHLAVQLGFPVVVEKLLEFGLNKNAKNKVRGQGSGRTRVEKD